MKAQNKKILSFFVSLIFMFFHVTVWSEAKKANIKLQDKIKENNKAKKVTIKLQDKAKESNKAKGIILSFKHWPLKESQKKEILKKTSTHQLKEDSQLPRFKVWVFKWDKVQKLNRSLNVCKEFSSLTYLKYCEPDGFVSPAGRGTLPLLQQN